MQFPNKNTTYYEIPEFTEDFAFNFLTSNTMNDNDLIKNELKDKEAHVTMTDRNDFYNSSQSFNYYNHEKKTVSSLEEFLGNSENHFEKTEIESNECKMLNGTESNSVVVEESELLMNYPKEANKKNIGVNMNGEPISSEFFQHLNQKKNMPKNKRTYRKVKQGVLKQPNSYSKSKNSSMTRKNRKTSHILERNVPFKQKPAQFLTKQSKPLNRESRNDYTSISSYLSSDKTGVLIKGEHQKSPTLINYPENIPSPSSIHKGSPDMQSFLGHNTQMDHIIQSPIVQNLLFKLLEIKERYEESIQFLIQNNPQQAQIAFHTVMLYKSLFTALISKTGDVLNQVNETFINSRIQYENDVKRLRSLFFQQNKDFLKTHETNHDLKQKIYSLEYYLFKKNGIEICKTVNSILPGYNEVLMQKIPAGMSSEYLNGFPMTSMFSDNGERYNALETQKESEETKLRILNNSVNEIAKLNLCLTFSEKTKPALSLQNELISMYNHLKTAMSSISSLLNIENETVNEHAKSSQRPSPSSSPIPNSPDSVSTVIEGCSSDKTLSPYPNSDLKNYIDVYTNSPIEMKSCYMNLRSVKPEKNIASEE